MTTTYTMASQTLQNSIIYSYTYCTYHKFFIDIVHHTTLHMQDKIIQYMYWVLLFDMQPDLTCSSLLVTYFGMTTVTFLSKLLASLMMNYFPKRTSGAPLHTLSKLYDFPVGFVSPNFETVYCYICGRKWWLLLDIGLFVLLFYFAVSVRLPSKHVIGVSD